MKKQDFFNQKMSIGQLNMQHLWKASSLFFPNSAVSRNLRTTFRDTLTSLKQDQTLFNMHVCKNCSSVFNSSNSQFKYEPKKRMTKALNKKLKRIWKQSAKAEFKQMASSFLQNSSFVKITCLSCNFKTKVSSVNYTHTLNQRKLKKTAGSSKSKKSRGINILRLNENLQETKKKLVPSWKREICTNKTHTSLNSFLASL